MKLTVQPRTLGKKGDVKRIRRSGNIPAVLYGPDKEAEAVTVSGDEFLNFLRKLPQGRLPTTVFQLHLGNQTHKAIVKEIQYHVTSYAVTHLDFAWLTADRKISVNVPIVIANESECIGVKLGGSLRQVIRFIRVECLPEHIPSEYEIDVKNMGLGESKRLSDLEIASHVRPISQLDEVMIVVSRGAVET